MRKRRDKG